MSSKPETSATLSIRPAAAGDFDRIWAIFHEVVKTGDTFAQEPDSSAAQARDMWLAPHVRAYVALVGGRIEGAYLIKDNQPGLGSHVANAAYMVDPATRAQGVGTAMGRHSLVEAKRLGYLAMQFNFVISTNERAVTLWKRLGFQIIGTSPKSYRHARLGLVDAFIMHRFLD